MKILQWIDSRLEETLVIVLMAVFVIASVLQVITRFIPQVNGTWTEEVARYAFIWMTFIGSAVAAKWDIHVRVDLIDLVVKNSKAKSILHLLSRVAFMVFLAIACYFGIEACLNLAKRPQTSKEGAK